MLATSAAAIPPHPQEGKMTDLATLKSESDAQIVGRVNGRPVTRGELSEAFDYVANRDNWKLPIDATVDLGPASMAMVREAVIFFTGSVPSFTAVGPEVDRCARFRVRAAGYYAAVGA
jgi:hypothetical protein